MDLREKQGGVTGRHPWERSRLRAIRRIFRQIPIRGKEIRILDLGCGDGYVCQALKKDDVARTITAVDIHLSENDLAELRRRGDGILYANAYDALRHGQYDLILLLDVLEHVEDDRTYLAEIVERYMSDGAYLLITASAWSFLYGSHDEFLKHVRRYDGKDLGKVIDGSGLERIRSGHLFWSLLPVRILQVAYEKAVRPKGRDSRGVGGWSRGEWVTNILERFLDADVSVSFMLNRVGVDVPGLTVWALCRKRP